ncbi:MAG: ABC transporter permease, partial [Acidimicrobiales bacterium]
GALALNNADTAALLEENRSVVTDLSKLGQPGDTFTRDFFLSATLLSFPQEAIGEVSAIPGVTSAVGGLTLMATHQTGTVPQIVAELQTGGETFSQTVTPDPLTPEEQDAFRQCLAANAPLPGAGGGITVQPGPGQAGPGGARGGASQQCPLPERFRQFRSTFTTPQRTIRQLLNPPSTDVTASNYTAAGVDPAHPEAGLVTTEQLTGGRWLATDQPDEVLASTAYANTNSLKVGSGIPINGRTFTVVGLVNPTLTGNTADLYFPLATLQELGSKQGRVTQVLVKVSDAGSLDQVAAAVRELLPGAQVVTSDALADQVTGSLSDAEKLASRLGGALAVIVLGAAFSIAVLLTLSSVAKRVREIGTLRAIGWSKGRVVRQMLAETLGIGLLGAALGIGIGFGAAAAVDRFSPTFTATSTGVPGFSGSPLSGLFGQATQAVAQTTQVQLDAPVRPATLALGVAFALLGGLLAGAIGGWRASRLAPATALRDLG